MDGENAKEKIVIDANIFLEFLLKQERTAESVWLMKRVEEGEFDAYITSFSLHSIEVILDRRKDSVLLEEFLDNVIQTQGLQIYQTEAIEEKDISALTRTLQLDFDDTLQYFVAKKLGAQLVSFDHDFDSTDLQRIEPRALLPDDNIESA